MLFSFSALAVALSALSLGALAAPHEEIAKRQTTACFLKGTTALPAEVADGVAALAKAVTCSAGNSVTGVPAVSSGGIAFSSIDFQKSTKSPLGFALETFKTPTNPSTANLATLQDQLNDYLAVEAGIRSLSSTNSALLTSVKSVKFFIQYQMARVRTAQGEKLGAADTVEHQLGKVTKNAIKATAAEIAQVNALAKQLK
ncbi:hypothetical protein D9611_006672 [Ephemerocybe angulata]|uniref:DUF7143 domain-containing protein n=1 Tax=Ephemerocybe angulata TaxID=980116 RepID=A0A8H5C7H3_9AGAR|nr:hypothetical protein D9611_006672 [Tulosesus angulatus]